MNNTPNKASDTFIFQRHDEIGAAAAEDDSQYLADCFVDTGDIAHLIDCNNPKRIIVGRTGAGKSALINELHSQQNNTIILSPHSLSLNFIANSRLITFFEETGVNLARFYGLLWRHILVVELLKKKFNIRNEESHKNYMRHIRSLVYKKDHIKEMAVDYFEKWGDKFWLTTEERVHELTEKIERNLSGAIGGSVSGVDISAEGARNLSQETRKEFTERGQKAVSEVQVRELENMISILADDIFNDPQEHYYICIDMLDEEWADDRIRFKLIRSLIDTVRRFKKISNIKIILAMRQDLLERVIHSSHESGFQEEKYKSLYLHISWSKKQLSDLIEKRMSKLVRRKYTKKPVTCKDIFPSKIDGVDPIDYILQRTFLRPRDAILFINECISQAAEHNALTATIIKRAEGEYSYQRLQSLATEWLVIYPQLIHTLHFFTGMKDRFTVSEITEDFFVERMSGLDLKPEEVAADPILRVISRALSDRDANFSSARNTAIRNLYNTGFLGLKTSNNSPQTWASTSRLAPAPGQLKPSSMVYIHPMFHRALDISSPRPRDG